MKSRIYFDYAATTPLNPLVLRAMLPYLTTEFGNPGSVHGFGQSASRAVFLARQTIANALGVDYHDIIFTASATEANNLALTIADPGSSLLISAIEHESITAPAERLRKNGVDLVIVPVNKSGQIDLKKLAGSISENTALVSIIYSNNEVGAVQNIKKISSLVKEKNPNTLVHTDASQAFQFLDCYPEKLGVDLLTLSAHKIYGPKGIGLLYANDAARKKIQPLVLGGGQEDSLRSGTENVANIVGFAKATELAEKNRVKESARIARLADELFAGIKKIFPSASLNGGVANRLPNNLSIYIPKISAEELLVALDLSGIAISAGPACSARAQKPSSTILALGYSEDRAKNSLRITLGWPTKPGDTKALLRSLKEAKKKLLNK